MAKATWKMPEDFLMKVSRLADKTDEILQKVLEAGAEVVEDKAVVFKKSNVDDLKEKMQFLCNYPKEVTKIKASVSQFVQKKFSWKKIVEMTLEIYKLSGDRYNAETR